MAVKSKRLGGYIVISGYLSLSQSFGSTFFKLFMVKNAGIAIRILTLSIIIPKRFAVENEHICCSST